MGLSYLYFYIVAFIIDFSIFILYPAAATRSVWILSDKSDSH